MASEANIWIEENKACSKAEEIGAFTYKPVYETSLFEE